MFVLVKRSNCSHKCVWNRLVIFTHSHTEANKSEIVKPDRGEREKRTETETHTIQTHTASGSERERERYTVPNRRNRLEKRIEWEK